MNSSVLPEACKYNRCSGSSTSTVNKYIIKKCKTTTYQKSFLIRTRRIWNCLADELDLSTSTLASFKSVIFNCFKSALAVFFDCEDPRSFKSICLKCNSARSVSSNNVLYVAVISFCFFVCFFVPLFFDIS